MKILDVPELLVLPDPAPYSENPSAFSDLVLTKLFRYDAALLHAEYRHPVESISWFISPRSEPAGGDPISLAAVSPSLGSFRSVLARFNVRFATTGIYGGFVMQFLRQNGRVHRCLIYTSNTGLSDYWIRVYAAVVDPSLWKADSTD
jgi:hypothetical protein